LLFFAEAVVLAGPFVVISLRQSNGVCEPGLHLLNSARQIAVPNAELDWDIAAAILAIDHEGAFAKANVGYLAQWHAPAIGSRQQDVFHRLGILAKARLITDYKIKAPVSFEDLGCSGAANRALYGCINICGHESISARDRSID